MGGKHSIRNVAEESQIFNLLDKDFKSTTIHSIFKELNYYISKEFKRKYKNHWVLLIREIMKKNQIEISVEKYNK